MIAAEPALAVVLSGERFDAALEAIAAFVDVKSPYSLGHSRAVAELAARAGAALALKEEEVRTLRRAGLLHDLGRLGVSNAIWDKPGPLGAGEWERVRINPYLTERMLHASKSLAPLGAIVVAHCERMDGSGYPRGLPAARSPPRRASWAANAYQAMCEPRPYRQALAAQDAAAELRDGGRAGRLDGDAVEAVLGAAGHRVHGAARPAGLTAREVEVLRLLARGMSNKEIALAPGSRPRPSATTSSTSTPRSARRRGPRRACSPCARVAARGRADRSGAGLSRAARAAARAAVDRPQRASP